MRVLTQAAVLVVLAGVGAGGWYYYQGQISPGQGQAVAQQRPPGAQGGPGGETRVPSVLIVLYAFSYSRVGMACAVAVVLTAIIFAVALLITRIGDRGEHA